MTEHQIQKQIVSYLRLRNILVIETDVMGGLQFFSHKDKRRFAFIGHHNAMGYYKGTSDLIILQPKQAVFVEIKTLIGRQSKEQKEFETRVNKLGFKYLIWRSLDDCIKFV